MKRAILFTISAGLIGATVSADASGADTTQAQTNQWALVEDAADGGTSAGLVYVPESKGMLLWGIRARKDWRGRVLSQRYWAELFAPASGEWSELVPDAGRVEVFQGRGTWEGKWVKHESGYEMPALPGCNRAYWHANQFCYVPELKKVFYYQGGMTFTYDPVAREFANVEIPIEQSPPDVMLGSMAWDPVNRQVILFGGGYVHQADWHTWDKRGTWAYDPAGNSWRKLTTGSREMCAAFEQLDTSIKGPLRDLWGGCRAAAFEYADQSGGKKAIDLSTDAVALGQELQATADELAGQGTDRYERSRFGAASEVLRERVCPKLVEAADALKIDDGWKAFHAVQSACNSLIDAREAVAVAPRPRHYARLVTDPVNKLIVLWGGDGEDRFFADTWLFDLAKGRWEHCRPDVHPANVGSAMVAMDYDSKKKVVVLVRQAGDVWTFDAKDRQWHKLAVAGFQGGATFMGMEYDPASDLHVLVAMKGQERKTQTLRPDVASAEVADAESSPGTEEAWRPGYGAGSGHPGDKVGRTWQLLPKTQSEFRQRVVDTKKFLDTVPANEWTRVPNSYGGFGRAYGSFCYKPEG